MLDVVRHPKMFDTDHLGPNEGLPTLDRWTVDLADGKVRESRVDDRGQEFPRVDERLVGKRHRYGYAPTVGEGLTGYGVLLKHDLVGGKTASRSFGADKALGEFVFHPSSPDAAEDDGVLMGYVYDRTADRSELAILDALRGVAIVWMTVFHFCFDLNYFGWIRQDFYQNPIWTGQRTAIVSLFLFCAGLGQAVAVDQGQPWSRFWKRWAQVAACAVLVTIGSYAMFPRSFIYFGVLHGIAVMLIVVRASAGWGRWLWVAGAAAIAMKWIAAWAIVHWPVELQHGQVVRSERFEPQPFVEDDPLPAVRAPREAEACLTALQSLAAA